MLRGSLCLRTHFAAHICFPLRINNFIIAVKMTLPARSFFRNFSGHLVECHEKSSCMSKNLGRRWFAYILGTRASRISILAVALAFIGIFWLLSEMDVVETGRTAGIIGVILFVIVAFPIALLVGRSVTRKAEPED